MFAQKEAVRIEYRNFAFANFRSTVDSLTYLVKHMGKHNRIILWKEQ